MSKEFVPVANDRLTVVANYLTRMATAERIYTEGDFAWRGAAGSRARDERSYRGPRPAEFSWRPRLVDTTYAAARVALTAAAEQAITIARLITDPALGVHGVLGVEVCTRSAVEVAARSWWLLDPGIGPHQRVCRYLVDQLCSAHAAETLAKAMGWKQPVDTLGVSPTTAAIGSTIGELGLTVKRPNSSDPVVDNELRPSATEMITDLVAHTMYRESAPMVYRLLSATTHGTLFGLMRSFRSVDDRFDGLPVVERETDHRIVESAAGVTMTSFLAVLDRAVTLMGWDHWRCTSLTNMTNALLRSGPR